MNRKNKQQMIDEEQSIINQHFHALRALLYIAKADKTFREAERRLFTLFFKRVAGHRMDSPELEDACMRRAIRQLPPTFGEFQYSVRQVAERLPDYRRAVCAVAKAMINTDAKPTPVELEGFDYLVKKLLPPSA
jgi:hypothetical protein